MAGLVVTARPPPQQNCVVPEVLEEPEASQQLVEPVAMVGFLAEAEAVVLGALLLVELGAEGHMAV